MGVQDTVEGRVSRAKALTLGNVVIALMDTVVRLQGTRLGGLPASGRRRLVSLFHLLEGIKGLAKSVFGGHHAAASSGVCVFVLLLAPVLVLLFVPVVSALLPVFVFCLSCLRPLTHHLLPVC